MAQDRLGGRPPTINMADVANYFCSVNVGRSPVKILLYLTSGNPLGPLLQQKSLAADYRCSLLHSFESLTRELRGALTHHCIVVVDNYFTTQSHLESLIGYVHSHGLYHAVSLVAVLSRIENTRTTESTIKDLILAGFSRALTLEECQLRFIWEMQMLEMSEVPAKQQLRFCHALFEAVEHSNDAVQISDLDSKILYVNRSFADMSGFSKDEVLGKPAMDIMRTSESKLDTVNGPSKLPPKKEQWEGPCLSRRKSGSLLKQHLKVIPVKSSSELVTHHVTIQRLLHSHEADHKALSTRNGAEGPSIGRRPLNPRVPSIPLTKVLHSLMSARAMLNKSCPPQIRESLDSSMEMLRSPDMYAVGLAEEPGARGIVAGLLMSGKPESTVGEPHRIQHVHHHLRHTPISPPPSEIQHAMYCLDQWNFDIIDLERVSTNEPLYYVGMKIFKDFEVGDTLSIEDSVLASWFKLIESNYHRVNSYHNSTHAADVLQATAYLIFRLQDHLIQGMHPQERLEQTEVAALLISAVIHDLDHPGKTNPFLCNTQDELALLYNDSAVLENHHVAQSFKLAQDNQQANIFQSLDMATFRQLRGSIIDLVLATDMAKHFEHLAKFNPVLQVDDTSSTTSLTGKECRESRMAMKRILVKCADISNPCRPLQLCREWAERIAEEYFAQTEVEKSSDLPVVFPDFDRQICKLPVTQVKFIDFFVSGLFGAWHSFCPIPKLMELLGSNYDYWKGQYESPMSSEEEQDNVSSST